MNAPSARPVLARGERCHVVDRDGRRYLDATSGAFCVTFGYTRPDFVAAASRAAERLPFARASSCDSEESEAYRAELLAAVGAPFSRVLLTSSGSEAVDLAIKVAVAYHRAQGRPERASVRSLAGHYHGATLGALRVTGWTARRDPYAVALGSRSDGLPRRGDDSAAFIAETVPVGGLGVAVPSLGEMAARRAGCDNAGVLWIADEVLTGFGRCGAMFAWQRVAARADARGATPDSKAVPDLVVFGKGAGAGFAAIGGVLISRAVASVLDGAAQPFSHYQTYGGSPIACAVGRAVLRAVREEGWPGRALAMEPELTRALAGFGGVSVFGALAGFDAPTSAAEYLSRGVFVHAAEGTRRVVAPSFPFGAAEFVEMREKLGAPS